MNRADNYSLLLLAGGKSSRMGTDKAELLYEGQTFVENLIEKAKGLGIQNIYLSGHQKNRSDVEVVWDIYPEVGPLGGLHAGLKAVTTPYCLVLPVDIPQIPSDFLESMIKEHELQCLHFKEKNLPLLLECDGFLEPLIGIYPEKMVDFIEGKIKEQRLSVFRMLKEWGNRRFTTDISGWQIANINTQEDYKNLIEMKKRDS